MTLLPKTALVVRDAEFAIDGRGQIAVLASNLPAPIVRARFGAIPKDAIAEFWNIRYARCEIAVFVMAKFLGADRRQAGNQHHLVRRRQLHDFARCQERTRRLLL